MVMIGLTVWKPWRKGMLEKIVLVLSLWFWLSNLASSSSPSFEFAPEIANDYNAFGLVAFLRAPMRLLKHRPGDFISRNSGVLFEASEWSMKQPTVEQYHTSRGDKLQDSLTDRRQSEVFSILLITDGHGEPLEVEAIDDSHGVRTATSDLNFSEGKIRSVVDGFGGLGVSVPSDSSNLSIFSRNLDKSRILLCRMNLSRKLAGNLQECRNGSGEYFISRKHLRGGGSFKSDASPTECRNDIIDNLHAETDKSTKETFFGKLAELPELQSQNLHGLDCSSCADGPFPLPEALSRSCDRMLHSMESTIPRRQTLSKEAAELPELQSQKHVLECNSCANGPFPLPEALSRSCEFCHMAMAAENARTLPTFLGPRFFFSKIVRLIMIPVAGVMLLLGLGVSLWWTSHRRHRRRGRGDQEVTFCPEIKTFPTRRFRLTADDIRQATSVCRGIDNIDNIRIGKGQASFVYKAVLGDGRSCAVKILTNGKFYHRSLARELQTLGRLRHGNLVKLLGYFFDAHTKALFLEYMPNGSLEKHLRACLMEDLSIDKRLGIAVDVARALVYLHHECAPRIVHGNLTPENIFLDFDLRARVGDVGLRRILRRLSAPDGCTSSEAYASTGHLSSSVQMDETFVDVYSYGVILLELVTGRRANNASDDFGSLSSWVEYSRSFIAEDSDIERLDDFGPLVLLKKIIRNDDHKKVIFGCIEVALLCMNPVHEERPTMRYILEMLLVHYSQKQSTL